MLMFSVYLCLNVLLNVREFNEFCCQSLIKQLQCKSVIASAFFSQRELVVV